MNNRSRHIQRSFASFTSTENSSLVAIHNGMSKETIVSSTNVTDPPQDTHTQNDEENSDQTVSSTSGTPSAIAPPSTSAAPTAAPVTSLATSASETSSPLSNAFTLAPPTASVVPFVSVAPPIAPSTSSSVAQMNKAVHNTRSPNSLVSTKNNPQPNASNQNNNCTGSITIFRTNSHQEGVSDTVSVTAARRGISIVNFDGLNIQINNGCKEIRIDTGIDNRMIAPPLHVDTDESAIVTNASEDIKDEIIDLDTPPSSAAPEISQDTSIGFHQNDIFTFTMGDDVYVLQEDERFHMATVVTSTDSECLVKFRNNTERWVPPIWLTMVDEGDRALLCVVCENTEEPNEVVVRCVRCGRGYHYKCANEKNGIWYCRRFHKNYVKDANGILKINAETNKQCSIKKLPYDLSALKWDKYHRENTGKIYCYCGQSGDWYKKMIQCAQCHQWFHSKCITSLHYPLYCGDRFYIFVCSLCNHGSEFLRRIEMKFEDIIHLILFNLTIHNTTAKYFDVSKIIVPYAIDNWHALQLPPNFKCMEFPGFKEKLVNTLNVHTNRFKGRGMSNKQMEYALRRYFAPPAPQFVLPVTNAPLTEECVRDYFMDNVKVNILPKSNDYVSDDPEMQMIMTGKGYVKASNYCHVINLDSDDDVQMETSINETNKTKHKSRPITPSRFELDSDTDSTDGKKSPSAKGKRGRPTRATNESTTPAYTTTASNNTSTVTTNDIHWDSSDDTSSSRGTLDLIIPPPKDFHGVNNPYVSQIIDKTQMKITSTNGTVTSQSTPMTSVPLLGNLKLPPTKTAPVKFGMNIPAGKQVRIVKRRLSARDIKIGPNQEVKRRKTRKSTGNVEVISTSTIHTLPKSSTYLPRFTIRPTLNLRAAPTSSSSASSTTSSSSTPLATTPTNIVPPSGSPFPIAQRLRRRSEPKNYAEGRRLLANGIANSSTSNAAILNVPGSPGKHNITKHSSAVSVTDLKASLTEYFGNRNRMGKGEPYAIIGRRITETGPEFLIEWEN